MNTQTALPIAPLNDPSLLTRLGSELRSVGAKRVAECDECGTEMVFDGALESLVLDLHDDQRHQGPAQYCIWAACRYAAGVRSTT